MSSRLVEYVDALKRISGDKQLQANTKKALDAINSLGGPEFVPPTLSSSLLSIVDAGKRLYSAFTGAGEGPLNARNVVSLNQRTPPPSGPGINY